VVRLDKSSRVFSKISWFDQIDSTNLELERQLSSGLPEFAAILAGSQTSGLGRLGRKWSSPPGSSLSLSIATSRVGAKPGWLSLLAAMAVRRALGELGVTAGIKWPNDIHVDDKKISGILSSLDSSGVAVVGIGLNLRAQDSSLPAVSLDELAVDFDIDSLAAQIGAEFQSLLDQFSVEPRQVRDEYSMHSITLGNRVRAILPDASEVIGFASEITDGGELVILTPEPITVSAADVWHLRS
jgi:BirA family transcriptional regulator, biotin operon repressor / biotin---[acetyl-CoA-carboxylase] ligase